MVVLFFSFSINLKNIITSTNTKFEKCNLTGVESLPLKNLRIQCNETTFTDKDISDWGKVIIKDKDNIERIIDEDPLILNIKD